MKALALFVSLTVLFPKDALSNEAPKTFRQSNVNWVVTSSLEGWTISFYMHEIYLDAAGAAIYRKNPTPETVAARSTWATRPSPQVPSVDELCVALEDALAEACGPIVFLGGTDAKWMVGYGRPETERRDLDISVERGKSSYLAKAEERLSHQTALIGKGIDPDDTAYLKQVSIMYVVGESCAGFGARFTSEHLIDIKDLGESLVAKIKDEAELRQIWESVEQTARPVVNMLEAQSSYATFSGCGRYMALWATMKEQVEQHLGLVQIPTKPF